MKAKLFLNILIMLFAIITISGSIYSSHYGIENQSANAQQPTNTTQQLAKPMGVKINSPIANQKVPVGELNISGTSTDTATTDCNVYVDVNDIKPLQNTTAAGPGGQNDYSNWTFTYTKKYHLLTEGQNELTAKVSCNGNSLMNNTNTSNITNAKSKWYSINVTGMAVQTPAEKSQNENQTQSSYGTQQNVTVSDEHQPETLNLTNQPLLSKNTQEQKIAVLNEKELYTRTQEDQKSQDNIPVQIESSTQDKSTIPNSFNAPVDLTEDTGSSQQLMPSSDIITEDTLSNKKERLIGGQTEQREIQPPLQMFELPNEGQAGTQVVEEEDFQDIELGDHEPNPQGHQLQPQIQLEPDQQTQMQPPLQMFDIGNQEHETEDEQQVIQTDDDDDDDATESAEEIFSMITGNSGQENDLEDIGEDVQEQDAEDEIADEIPLVQSYTREIQNTLE